MKNKGYLGVLLILVMMTLAGFQNCNFKSLQSGEIHSTLPIADSTAPDTNSGSSGDVSFKNDDKAPLGCKRWPQLCGRAGPYAVMGSADEILDVKAADLNMVGINSPYPDILDPYRKAIADTQMAYIDLSPSQLVFSACHEADQVPGYCNLSEQRKDKIISDFQKHLANTAADPQLIAYWILDDNPGGDLKDILVRMRNAVMQSNANGAAIPRPTICGFGSILDPAPGTTLSETMKQNYAGWDNYIKAASKNFTPLGCDFVAFYNYSYAIESGRDRSMYDWTMSELLPRLYGYLKEQGWDQDIQPVIGMPSAFGWEMPSIGVTYVTPLKTDLQTQVISYCDQGAVALFPYTWNDTVPNSQELGNNKDLLDGFLLGYNECKKNWRTFKPTLKMTPAVAYFSQGPGNQLFEVTGAKGICTFTIYAPNGEIIHQAASADFPNMIWPNKSIPVGDYTIVARDENGAVGTAIFKIVQ